MTADRRPIPRAFLGRAFAFLALALAGCAPLASPITAPAPPGSLGAVRLYYFYARSDLTAHANLLEVRFFHEKFFPLGVPTLGVQPPWEDPAEAAAFAEENYVNFPTGVDREGLRERYKVRLSPAAVMLDHRGRVRLHQEGTVSREDLERMARRLLEEFAIEKAETPGGRS